MPEINYLSVTSTSQMLLIAERSIIRQQEMTIHLSSHGGGGRGGLGGKFPDLRLPLNADGVRVGFFGFDCENSPNPLIDGEPHFWEC